MSDPITVGISSAVAGAAIDQIRKYIDESEDPEEAWGEAIRECVIQTKVAIKQKIDVEGAPDRSGLKREAELIGESAQNLSVRGDLKGFDEELVELAEEFAEACAVHARSPMMSSAEDLSAFRNVLEETGEEILSKTEQ